ncbi:hypothetical protein, partial [Brevibacterium rongguiense]|uniref:hypothetical protein n=1 Tax=Brevibacterium rongguiense TaxID=2695267 RepID=UPI001F1A947E
MPSTIHVLSAWSEAALGVFVRVHTMDCPDCGTVNEPPVVDPVTAGDIGLPSIRHSYFEAYRESSGLMHDQVSHDLWRRAALQGRMCAMPAPYPQEFREDVVRVAR